MQIGMGNDCDTVMLGLEDIPSVLGEKLDSLENLAGHPLRVSPIMIRLLVLISHS